MLCLAFCDVVFFAIPCSISWSIKSQRLCHFDIHLVFFSLLFRLSKDPHERVCILCNSSTYYNCVKCGEAICNRPDCSSSVDENHPGYSEDHPKAVSICVACSSSKKRQSNISTFFQPRFVHSHLMTMACIVYQLSC